VSQYHSSFVKSGANVNEFTWLSKKGLDDKNASALHSYLWFSPW
jgi:hypothetical protein